MGMRGGSGKRKVLQEKKGKDNNIEKIRVDTVPPPYIQNKHKKENYSE